MIYIHPAQISLRLRVVTVETGETASRHIGNIVVVGIDNDIRAVFAWRRRIYHLLRP